MNLGIELKEDGQAVRVIWNHLNEMYESVKGVETMEFPNCFQTKEQFLVFVSSLCETVIASDKEELLDKE